MKIARKFCEAVVNNHQRCLIHDIPMKKEGEPDLCGTYVTFCPKCRKEEKTKCLTHYQN